MSYKISLEQINAMVSKSYFANEGDVNERIYWPLFNKGFQNCEQFWRYFVIPFTKRIITEIKDPNERIRQRDGVSPDVFDLGFTHYSMFLNLVYAHNHLREPKLSSFEDFYIHLCSACDLAEAFLCKSYLITLECLGGKSKILQECSKDDFLEFAGRWYDTRYSKAYEAFVIRQKPLFMNIANKNNILDEYFAGEANWNKYKTFTQLIRQYRNVIIHETQIGRIISLGGMQLVPKKDKISTYKDLSKIFSANNDPVTLEKDFVDMKQQMFFDIEELQSILNGLWEKPLKDLTKLFYKDKNAILLKKYNFTEV